MSELLHMPLAVAYLWVGWSIAAGPRPGEPWRVWWAAGLAAVEVAVTVDLQHWTSAAVWAFLLWLQCDELRWAYRVELYRRG